jgi:hypothetical protein
MATITQLPTGAGDGDQPMGPTVRRTRAGSEELVTQKRSLSNAQRNVLLYANGKRSMEALSQMIPAVAEHPDIIIDMKNDGLIELIDPELGEVIDAGSAREAHAQTGRGPGEGAADAGQAGPGAGNQEDLSSIKNELRPEIQRLLGSEGDPALKRLDQITTRDELSQLIAKLVDLVKLYAGTPAGERFASQFRQWL